MITIGEVNRLTFEAVGYKNQECYSEWDDFLMIDIKYFSRDDEIIFQCDFPYIMAKEFATIAGDMREFMESDEVKRVIDFSEPNLSFTLEKTDIDRYRVTAEIFVSYKDGNTIVKNHWFYTEDFEKFIKSIEDESKKFPPRIE